jgi:hypothetical protein
VAATTEEKLTWFLLGWASVFAIKYLVIGLKEWNNTFHPGLIIAENQQPFYYPWLGAFYGGGETFQRIPPHGGRGGAGRR